LNAQDLLVESPVLQEDLPPGSQKVVQQKAMLVGSWMLWEKVPAAQEVLPAALAVW